MQFNKSWNTKVPNYKVQDYNFAGVCNHTKQYILLSIQGTKSRKVSKPEAQTIPECKKSNDKKTSFHSFSFFPRKDRWKQSNLKAALNF